MLDCVYVTDELCYLAMRIISYINGG